MMPERGSRLTNVRDKCLEELDALLSSGLEGASYLLSQLRRLGSVPLKQLRIKDRRLLIGQSVGLEFLIPIALDHRESHPWPPAISILATS
jgi:CDI immunity proteins